MKYIKVPDGESFIDVKTMSEDPENNTRTVAFIVDSDINEPLLMQMHILIESMQPVYDHKYSVRLQFDLDSIERIGEVPPRYIDELIEDEQSAGFLTNGYMLAVLALIVLVVLIVWVRRSKNKNR